MHTCLFIITHSAQKLPILRRHSPFIYFKCSPSLSASRSVSLASFRSRTLIVLDHVMENFRYVQPKLLVHINPANRYSCTKSWLLWNSRHSTKLICIYLLSVLHFSRSLLLSQCHCSRVFCLIAVPVANCFCLQPCWKLGNTFSMHFQHSRFCACGLFGLMMNVSQLLVLSWPT